MYAPCLSLVSACPKGKLAYCDNRVVIHEFEFEAALAQCGREYEERLRWHKTALTKHGSRVMLLHDNHIGRTSQQWMPAKLAGWSTSWNYATHNRSLFLCDAIIRSAKRVLGPNSGSKPALCPNTIISITDELVEHWLGRQHWVRYLISK